jgi:hypothetical protein
MTRRVLAVLFVFFAWGGVLFGLPYIPGCPLHESCVRALRQEQRNRRRGLKNTDRLAGLERKTGLNLGIRADLGDLLEEPILGLRPSLSWSGGFGGLDVYLGGFYTVSFDYPRVQGAGFQENLSYSFFPADKNTLTLSLDNDNQMNVSGGTAELLYAAAEPGLCWTRDLPPGEVSLSLGLPLGYGEEFSVDTALGLGWRFPWGLYLEAAARIWVEPEPDYGETEFTLGWLNGRFYASLTINADRNFTTYSIEPYAAWSAGRFTLFAGLLVEGIGRGKALESAEAARELGLKEGVSLIPSLGVRWRF